MSCPLEPDSERLGEQRHASGLHAITEAAPTLGTRAAYRPAGENGCDEADGFGEAAPRHRKAVTALAVRARPEEGAGFAAPVVQLLSRDAHPHPHPHAPPERHVNVHVNWT